MAPGNRTVLCRSITEPRVDDDRRRAAIELLFEIFFGNSGTATAGIVPARSRWCQPPRAGGPVQPARDLAADCVDRHFTCDIEFLTQPWSVIGPHDRKTIGVQIRRGTRPRRPSTVYRAVDESLGRPVAIKVLHVDASNSGLLEHFSPRRRRSPR
jgi:hypothetical protein